MHSLLFSAQEQFRKLIFWAITGLAVWVIVRLMFLVCSQTVHQEMIVACLLFGLLFGYMNWPNLAILICTAFYPVAIIFAIGMYWRTEQCFLSTLLSISIFFVSGLIFHFARKVFNIIWWGDW